MRTSLPPGTANCSPVGDQAMITSATDGTSIVPTCFTPFGSFIADLRNYALMDSRQQTCKRPRSAVCCPPSAVRSEHERQQNLQTRGDRRHVERIVRPRG